MHASINHDEKFDTNGDLNIALPTNILNTSSILKYATKKSRKLVKIDF